MKTGQQTGLTLSFHEDGSGTVTDSFVPRSLRQPLTLSDGEVHVWLASLRSTSAVILDLWSTLAGDEKQRALRFRFQKDCDRFIVARGLLRAMIGLYLDRVPAQIEFSYNEYGKPSVLPEQGSDELHFNLSHSDTLALFAFTRYGQVGVDIEKIRRDLVSDSVAEQFFSIKEQQDLRTLTLEARDRAFFNCWTRKEAFVKARGKGLSLPLDMFDVSVFPEEAAGILEVRDGETNASKWSLKEIFVGNNHVAAVAVEGHDWQPRCWKLAS